MSSPANFDAFTPKTRALTIVSSLRSLGRVTFEQCLGRCNFRTHFVVEHSRSADMGSRACATSLSPRNEGKEYEQSCAVLSDTLRNLCVLPFSFKSHECGGSDA